MLQFQLFPRSVCIPNDLLELIQIFNNNYSDISSDNHSLKSNDVLAALKVDLEKIGYSVERGKSSEDKIHVPVLFGKNNSTDKTFYADALSGDGRIVLEVEAGRALENNQFLKDIFEASMMYNVEYLALAIRNQYRNHFDFEKIYTFLETLYISGRIQLPLKGILLIGY